MHNFLWRIQTYNWDEKWKIWKINCEFSWQFLDIFCVQISTPDIAGAKMHPLRHSILLISSFHFWPTRTHNLMSKVLVLGATGSSMCLRDHATALSNLDIQCANLKNVIFIQMNTRYKCIDQYKYRVQCDQDLPTELFDFWKVSLQPYVIWRELTDVHFSEMNPEMRLDLYLTMYRSFPKTIQLELPLHKDVLYHLGDLISRDEFCFEESLKCLYNLVSHSFSTIISRLAIQNNL